MAGSDIGPDSNLESGERATWLAGFTLKWLVVTLLGANATLAVLAIERALDDFGRASPGIGAIIAAALVGAEVGLAWLTRSRLIIGAAVVALASIVLMIAGATLARGWTGVSLADVMHIGNIGLSLLASFGFARVVAPNVIGYGLATLVFGIDLTLNVSRLTSDDPFASFIWLELASCLATMALLAVALVRPPRLAPGPIGVTRGRTALDALTGFWTSAFVSLTGSWAIVILGAIAPRITSGLFVALVIIDVVALALLVRAARALLDAGVPRSVGVAATSAVTLRAIGCLFTLSGLGLMATSSETRGILHMINMRELAYAFVMSSAAAGCWAVAMAARWAGEDVALGRARLAARFAAATLLMLLPPVANAATSYQLLGNVALDAFWVAGIIMLWRAVEDVRTGLTRRAITDLL